MSEAKQHFERVRNSVVAAVITLASIPVVRAQTGDPTPIYLDPKRPIEKRVRRLDEPHDTQGKSRAAQFALRLRA